MFKALGVCVLGYVVWCWSRDEVDGHSGVRRTVVTRDETPVRFWLALGCYTLLGIGLLTLF